MCRKMLTGVALLCLAGGAVLPVAAATGAACAPRGGLSSVAHSSGVAASSSLRPFPNYRAKYAQHYTDFTPRYANAQAYENAAQRIANDVTIECKHVSRGRHVFWTGGGGPRGGIVIVQNGAIQTYYIGSRAAYNSII